MIVKGTKSTKISFNSLPDDKILDQSKYKQIADDFLMENKYHIW